MEHNFDPLKPLEGLGDVVNAMKKSADRKYEDAFNAKKLIKEGLEADELNKKVDCILKVQSVMLDMVLGDVMSEGSILTDLNGVIDDTKNNFEDLM
jgi:hypothetical protein